VVKVVWLVLVVAAWGRAVVRAVCIGGRVLLWARWVSTWVFRGAGITVGKPAARAVSKRARPCVGVMGDSPLWVIRVRSVLVRWLVMPVGVCQ
jgi:hypothetical protein